MRTGSMPARTVLVAGPPCSGKTTYVANHRQPDDLVLDFDMIARELGSPVLWLHPHPYRDQAEQVMRARLRGLPGSGPHTAWVIRSAAAAKIRAIAARKIHAAACLVINPGYEICLDRARADGRPAGTEAEIRRWFAAYSPWSGDGSIADSTRGRAQSPALSFFDTSARSLDHPPTPIESGTTTPVLDHPPTPQ